jgi:hypothetical protein
MRGECALTWQVRWAGWLPEWGGQEVRLGQEEDVIFTREGCRPIRGRQTELRVI